MPILQVDIEGEPILIEVNSAYGSQPTTSVQNSVEKVGDAFEQAKGTIIHVSSSMVKAVRRLDQAVTPHEFTMEFGIKFTAEGTVMLASATAECNIKVTMKYIHDKKRE